MFQMKNYVLVVLAMLSLTLGATEALSQPSVTADNDPVGYFVDNLDINGTDSDEVKSQAQFIRDGKEYEAFAGQAVYVGDTIVTGASGGISIAFLNNSAARLGGSTEFNINKVGKKSAELTLVHGRMSLLNSPPFVIENIFLNLGSLGGNFNVVGPDDEGGGGGGGGGGSGGGTVKAKNCLAQFQVIVNKDANGTTFTSSVAVLKGTATLTPKGSSGVDLTSGTQAILTLKTNVAGVAASPVTLQQSNLSSAQIATLLTTAVSNTITCVNKDGSVTIKSAIKNGDGTISVGSNTTVNGKVTKDNWVTFQGKSKVDIWVETSTKISITKTFDGYTLKSSVGKPADSGLATLKGPNGITYKGSTKYDPSTGAYVFKSSNPGKDGSSALFSYNPNGPSGPINTVIITPKSGPAQQVMQSFNKTTGLLTLTTQTGTVVNGVFVPDSTPPVVKTTQLTGSAPSAKTPDGHSIDQNDPPVTQ